MADGRTVAAGPAPAHATLRSRLVGIVALVSATGLIRLPFRRQMAALRRLRWVCPREATMEEATAARDGVLWAAQWFPGRAACLETSIATVVACALQRRSVAWHLGVTVTPPSSHAWVTAGGVPVGEPADVSTRYRTVGRGLAMQGGR